MMDTDTKVPFLWKYMKGEDIFNEAIDPADLAICGISTEENRNNLVELIILNKYGE